MTPKEKAKELIDRFSLVGLQQRNEGVQCALIAVEEILHVLNKIIEITGSSFVFDEIQYYQQVKQEILNQQ